MFVPHILTNESKNFEHFFALKVGRGSTYTRVSKFATSHSSKLSELYRQWLGVAVSVLVCETVKPNTSSAVLTEWRHRSDCKVGRTPCDVNRRHLSQCHHSVLGQGHPALYLSWSAHFLHSVCMLRECIYGECAHEQPLTITLTHTITRDSVSGNVVRVRILICATRQKLCRKRVYPSFVSLPSLVNFPGRLCYCCIFTRELPQTTNVF